MITWKLVLFGILFVAGCIGALKDNHTSPGGWPKY